MNTCIILALNKVCMKFYLENSRVQVNITALPSLSKVFDCPLAWQLEVVVFLCPQYQPNTPNNVNWLCYEDIIL